MDRRPACPARPSLRLLCAALLASAGACQAGDGDGDPADPWPGVALQALPLAPHEATAASPAGERQRHVRDALALQSLLPVHAGLRTPADLRLQADVHLPPTLPGRVRQLLGKPEGAMTVEWRRGPGLASQLGVGSLMRWQAGGGQLTLRLRGGRLGLQYGLRFNL